MKNKIVIALFSALLIFSQDAEAGIMKFKSADIKSGGNIKEAQVFNSFGCNGLNKSPQLSISGVPKGTKSLAITMYDPDAPTGSGWWHWIVYDIDPTVTEIPAGVEKISSNAVMGRNDYGDYKYGGPCPPVKTRHRYVFTLYALDVEKLDVPEGASAAMIGFNLNAHTIKKEEFSGFYSRK